MTRKSTLVLLFSVCAIVADAQEEAPIIACPEVLESNECCTPGICDATENVRSRVVIRERFRNHGGSLNEQLERAVVNSAVCDECAESRVVRSRNATLSAHRVIERPAIGSRVRSATIRLARLRAANRASRVSGLRARRVSVTRSRVITR